MKNHKKQLQKKYLRILNFSQTMLFINVVFEELAMTIDHTKKILLMKLLLLIQINLLKF